MKEKRKVRGQLGVYLQWPLLLSILIIIMTVAVGTIDTTAGLAMCGFAILYMIIAIFLYAYKRKGIMAGMIEFSAEYAWIQKKLLMSLHIPYAILDEAGRILWMNEQFVQIIKEERGNMKTIQAMFPEIAKEELLKMKEDVSLHSSFGERRYRIELKPVVLEREDLSSDSSLKNVVTEDKSLIAVYLFDETEILRLTQEVDDQKMVSGLIYLDNYEEALASVEEVRRSLLMALIDRKISKYINRMSGIVKKMEKDKYFFAIKQKYVEELREQRFSILEEVKAVNIGNEMSVTLSIGLGMNGDTYAQNYELARMAMDMALGRGGDQAVLKDREKIEYFGGKSQQQEKTTRVKARVKAHALQELMETKDRLLIMGHKLADMDSFGACVGIYRIAASLNKKAHIVINEVTSSVRPMMERFLNNPDYPDDLFLTGERARELVDANTILVVVDVNRPSITDAPELLRLAKTIVVLDHHRQSSEIITNAVLSYVEPYASSACELVAEVLQYIGDGIKVKPQEADAMYAGIVIDTNNFNNQAGVRTFEAAAYLRRSGADITRVRKMFREEMVDYKAKAEAVRQADVYQGAFAISVCPSEGIENPTIVAAQAANELLEIKGIKASVVMSKYNGTIYLSARSIDEVNVQVMMERLGGGGHRTIAGAQLPGASIEEAREKVKKAIQEMLEKGEVS
ncbi:MAG: DHH family phosphoesterase [Hungatella sp.]|nr:DHH family phosphoesterase [Hungatella sp.]